MSEDAGPKIMKVATLQLAGAGMQIGGALAGVILWGIDVWLVSVFYPILYPLYALANWIQAIAWGVAAAGGALVVVGRWLWPKDSEHELRFEILLIGAVGMGAGCAQFLPGAAGIIICLICIILTCVFTWCCCFWLCCWIPVTVWAFVELALFGFHAISGPFSAVILCATGGGCLFFGLQTLKLAKELTGGVSPDGGNDGGDDDGGVHKGADAIFVAEEDLAKSVPCAEEP